MWCVHLLEDSGNLTIKKDYAWEWMMNMSLAIQLHLFVWESAINDINMIVPSQCIMLIWIEATFVNGFGFSLFFFFFSYVKER